MDWLFDNLGKFAPVVIFLLYMISSLKGKGQPEEEEPDPAAAERARKIQEEIRRKILERQRGDAGPTARPPEETIIFDESQEEYVAPPRPEPVRQQAPDDSHGRVDQFDERRREIEAKLEEAKNMHRMAKEKAGPISKGDVPLRAELSPIEAGEIRTRLSKALGDRDSLKTAILLREVLDRPVGMR